MAQKRGIALSKTFAFQDEHVYLSDPWRDHAQQCKVDSVLTWSNILCFFFNVVDLSSKLEPLKLMHIFWDKGLLNNFQFQTKEYVKVWYLG